MIVYILISILLILVIYTVSRVYLNHDKSRILVEDQIGKTDASPLVSSGEIDWQTLNKHLRLKEYISFEGVAISGDKYQAIFSLSVGSQIHLIYFAISDSIYRVRAGDVSIMSIKSGEGLRVRLSDNQVTMTELKDVNNKVEARSLIRDSGFELVVLLTNSLVDGMKILYASRAATLSCGFIKEWDIPTTRSDVAGLADISSVADMAKLAEKVKDIQFTALLENGGNAPFKIKSGVCYVLGKNGNEKITVDCNSDIAVMIVPEFGGNISLADFIKNLNVVNQMHARIVYEDGLISVAAQNPDGIYNAISTKERNVLLTMVDGSGVETPVLKIESTINSSTVINVYYVQSQSFKNVIMWRVN